MTSRLPVLVLAVLAACGARAENSPWYIGAAQGFTHSSNVRLVPDVPGLQADGAIISSTTLLGGLDQPIGRQRVSAAATLRQLVYQGNSDLNNLSYDLSTALDWSTVERLSGRIALATDRQLNLRTDQPCAVPASGQKSLQSNSSLGAQVRLGVVTALTLEGNLDWREQTNSLAAYDCQDARSTTVSVGMRYAFSGALSAGVALRHARNENPRAVGGASTANDNNLDLSATWQASGASSLDARLSLGRRSDTSNAARDFSGATGVLVWKWQPTGKIRLTTTAQRDTGADTYNRLQLLGANQVAMVRADNSVLTSSLSSRLNYEVTGKIAATAGLRLSQRDLADLGAVPGSDKTVALSLGATWAPTRSILTGCDLSQDKRTSSYLPSLPYSVNSFGCYVQMVLQ